MDAAMERRVGVATTWSTARVKFLDREERYEDSYAVTQEFREWITCAGENISMLDESVLISPALPDKYRQLNDHVSNDHRLEI
ncbi:hypothetical protein [Synechococcus sp. M16CYN]|uniref:hypothetical protein n=1 Tax=Synechococcus sp. M16CYN TaxID=3103139 RepID=UPI003252470E